MNNTFESMPSRLRAEASVLLSSFELSPDINISARVIESFPYPIQVYNTDGVLLMINRACLEVMHIPSKELLVGKFNVLTDPVIDSWGSSVRAQIKESFKGDIVHINDIHIPTPDIIKRFEGDDKSFDSSYQNITCFPVFDENSRLIYIVHFFMTSRYYLGRHELNGALDYFNAHWLEEFNLDSAARSVNLSRYHFARMFKNYTGLTPLGYYQEIKIKKIKEKLCDVNLSVSEAFSECGLNYSGNYTRLFRKKTGMTPSQYKKANT